MPCFQSEPIVGPGRQRRPEEYQILRTILETSFALEGSTVHAAAREAFGTQCAVAFWYDGVPGTQRRERIQGVRVSVRQI